MVLDKVCEYLYYSQKHAESKDVSDMDIPPELCLELLIAADYLDGEFTSKEIRSLADNRSMSESGVLLRAQHFHAFVTSTQASLSVIHIDWQ